MEVNNYCAVLFVNMIFQTTPKIKISRKIQRDYETKTVEWGKYPKKREKKGFFYKERIKQLALIKKRAIKQRLMFMCVLPFEKNIALLKFSHIGLFNNL